MCKYERDQYNGFYSILYTYRCTESSKTSCGPTGKEQWRIVELGCASMTEISVMTFTAYYIRIDVLKVVQCTGEHAPS